MVSLHFQSFIVGKIVTILVDRTLYQAVQAALSVGINKAERPINQLVQLVRTQMKCISKGNSLKPFEFVMKVGIASKLHGNLIVETRSFRGNQYDARAERTSGLSGHCAAGQQYENLNSIHAPRLSGPDKHNLGLVIKNSCKIKSLIDEEMKSLKRR